MVFRISICAGERRSIAAGSRIGALLIISGCGQSVKSFVLD